MDADLKYPMDKELVNKLLNHASQKSCFAIANVVFNLAIADNIMGFFAQINDEEKTGRLIAVLNINNHELEVPVSLESFFSPIEELFFKKLQQLTEDGDTSAVYCSYKAIL